MAEQNYPNSKKFTYTVLALVVVAFIALASGYIIIKNGVSADTVSTPPTPPDPADNDAIVNPPTPPDPAATGLFFKSGWSIVPGYQLKAIDLAKLRTAGIQIYSYNDPMFNARTWAIYPPGCTGDICATEFAKFDFRDPFAYYAYNSKADYTISFTGKVSESKIKAIGKGWHLMFWSKAEADYNTMAENILVTYENSKTVTWKEANAENMHSVSNQIYVVTAANSTSPTAAVKKLSTQDSATEISKIPANSYIWTYARKTKSPIKKIEIKGSTFIGAWEKDLVEAWLKKNNLNECGDVVGTAYAGGSCLFDETTGKLVDKYEYLIKKFPARPWLVLQVSASPTPTITSTTASDEPAMPPSPKL